MNDITIIYSSGGGNTKLVVDKVSEILTEQKFQVELINAIVATPEDLHKTDITILAAPTYDHGIIHAPFERLLHHAKDVDLSSGKYAVIGLGDNKYDEEYNVETAPILEAFVKEHNGILLHKSLRINKSPIPHLDSTIASRATNLVQTIHHG